MLLQVSPFFLVVAELHPPIWFWDAVGWSALVTIVIVTDLFTPRKCTSGHNALKIVLHDWLMAYLLKWCCKGGPMERAHTSVFLLYIKNRHFYGGQNCVTCNRHLPPIIVASFLKSTNQLVAPNAFLYTMMLGAIQQHVHFQHTSQWVNLTRPWTSSASNWDL